MKYIMSMTLNPYGLPPNFTHEKISDKFQLRDILENALPAFLKGPLQHRKNDQLSQWGGAQGNKQLNAMWYSGWGPETGKNIHKN